MPQDASDSVGQTCQEGIKRFLTHLLERYVIDPAINKSKQAAHFVGRLAWSGVKGVGHLAGRAVKGVAGASINGVKWAGTGLLNLTEEARRREAADVPMLPPGCSHIGERENADGSTSIFVEHDLSDDDLTPGEVDELASFFEEHGEDLDACYQEWIDEKDGSLHRSIIYDADRQGELVDALSKAFPREAEQAREEATCDLNRPATARQVALVEELYRRGVIPEDVMNELGPEPTFQQVRDTLNEYSDYAISQKGAHRDAPARPQERAAGRSVRSAEQGMPSHRAVAVTDKGMAELSQEAERWENLGNTDADTQHVMRQPNEYNADTSDVYADYGEDSHEFSDERHVSKSEMAEHPQDSLEDDMAFFDAQRAAEGGFVPNQEHDINRPEVTR